MKDTYSFNFGKYGAYFKHIERRADLTLDEVNNNLNAGARALYILDSMIAKGSVRDYENEIKDLVNFIKDLRLQVNAGNINLTSDLEVILNIILKKYPEIN